jgi:hypothetical protein
MVAVFRGRRPRPCLDTISPEIWTALNRCWATRPAERPSAYALSVLFNVSSRLRQEDGPSLSPQQANNVLDFVDEYIITGDTYNHNEGSHNISSIHTGQLAPAPYHCYWPQCGARFDGLVGCQTHQLTHFPSM